MSQTLGGLAGKIHAELKWSAEWSLEVYEYERQGMAERLAEVVD
ncbi:hypothetical protein [Uliginosibacterium gangwonense]|nr:hypothetical protein [Uliginosibacterium gangwonense]